ncbi:hypothetical protein G6F64_014893 [Rhizopus arrhizus]|uniref:Uncharacterized protein n=1 Tax=Rhizopus oryzae TaxID=64495 RepID=A0A9P6WTC0_RHIOR|nr:hypothetical protein G6F64_014893 [Rhizopus arrhizus]
MTVLHGAQRLVAGAGAAVEQGGQDRDRQRTAARALDHLAGADHAIQAVQGQRFGLGRDDQAIGSRQRIDHQQAEGRRAVQQDVVVLALVARHVASADCAQT